MHHLFPTNGTLFSDFYTSPPKIHAILFILAELGTAYNKNIDGYMYNKNKAKPIFLTSGCLDSFQMVLPLMRFYIVLLLPSICHPRIANSITI